MMVIDMVPCEDAHAQERSLVDQVLPGVGPGDLWIADRSFCTTQSLFGVRARRGSFLVRQHRQTLRWEPTTPLTDAGRVATGFVQEQLIRVIQGDGEEVIELRRIRLRLDRKRPMNLVFLGPRPFSKMGGGTSSLRKSTPWLRACVPTGWPIGPRSSAGI